MGIDFLKGAGTETAEQIARQSLAGALAKGGGKLVAAEVPTEMGQQALERYYAGLSLTDESAMREYAEAGAGAAMLAPLGMAGSGYQRRQAKKIVEQQEAEKEQKLADAKKKELQALKEELDAKRISEREARRVRQQIEFDAQERKAEIDAALKRARETGQPVKSIQQIIDEMTGVAQVKKPLSGKRLSSRKKQFQEALDEPSGQFVVGVDGVERERTEAEAQGIPVEEPKVFTPAKDKLTKDYMTKGLGIGPTAVVVRSLEGKDPTSIEDNRLIRLALDENLKKREEGSPAYEKIEAYLNTIPTTQELENGEYQKAVDDEAARGSYEVDDESAAADTLLSSVNDTGRTTQPAITNDELARRKGPLPDSLVDPETEQEVEIKGALTREEFDKQQEERTNKGMAEEARVIRQNAKKAEPLRKFLNKMGIARSQMYDITGDTKGKTMLFRNSASLIEDIVSDNQGNILQYAPADMVARSNLNNPNAPSDPTELVNFFRDKIRADDLDFRPTDVEQTLFDADIIEEQIKPLPKKSKPLTKKEIEINKNFPADFELTREPYSLAGSIEQVVKESYEDYQARIDNYLNNRLEGETESEFNKRTGLKDVEQTSAKTGKPRKASTLTGNLGDVQYAGEKKVRALSQIPPGTQINWNGKDWTVDKYEISDKDRRAPGDMSIRLISRDTGEGLYTNLGGLVNENTSGSIYDRPLEKTPANPWMARVR